MVLKNSIGSKIALGFTLILVIMLVIVGLAINSLKSGSSDFKQYREFARESVLSGRVQANMLLASRAAGSFLKTRDEKYYEAYLTRIVQAKKFAIEQQEVMDDPKRKELSIELVNNLDSYRAVSERVFNFMRQRDNILVQRLDPQGIKMRHNLDEIMIRASKRKDANALFNASTALKSVLLGRLYVLKFLDRNKKANVDRVRTELGVGFENKYSGVANSIKGVNSQKLLEEFSVARTIYLEAFNDMVKTINSRNVLIDQEMQPLDKRIADISEKIKLSIKKSQDTLGPQVQKRNEFSVNAAISTSIVALLLAIITVYLIVKAITKPISSLVNVVESVQKSGNLSLRVANSSGDEIGLISDAFNGFLDSLQLKMSVAKNVAKGILATEVTILSSEDSFGESLQVMLEKLREKEKSLKAISVGDVDVDVDVQSTDDQLSVTINKMITDMREIAKKADIIASGDYSIEMKPRSDKDVLMQSLYRMTKTLRENASKAEYVSWQKNGINIVNDEIRGNLTEVQLADKSTSAICKHIDVQGAVYYGYDSKNEELEFKGGYALDHASSEFTNIGKGQGLSGQAAIDKKPILLNNLPDHFFKIQSFSGNAQANGLLIYPLIYDGELLAVLEFMSLANITNKQQEFLPLIEESICIGILGARHQKKSENLLEKTQVQTQELQLRQQELETSNQLLANQKTDLEDQKEIVEVTKNKLEKSIVMAEQASQSKSDFLANMSHEIRTPMNAILGMSHLALQTDLTRKQRNYIDKTHRAAESLLGIINDILDFSKIEAGKLDIENIDFRLEDVFDNLANLVGLKAEDKGLELMFDIPSNLPTALIGDPLRLGQILTNLGNNAVKFTDKGEVVIGVKVLKQDEDSVELHFLVSDTGLGISQEEKKKLFQSFSQVDTSVTRKFGGTGLGLAISKQLTKLMDGKIWVDSEEGKGSCFQFTANLGKQKGEITERRSIVSALGSLKVLVVDDNNSAREIFSDMLANMGLLVDQSHSGKEALAKLETNADGQPYDLVLMDWKMPDMDGIETARKIQASEGLGEVPTIIMVTAYGREDVMQASEGLNIQHYLTKPVTPSHLLDSIMEAMGHGDVHDVMSRNQVDGLAEDIAKLKNAYVLLVEDNDVNQELALELLVNNGLKVEVASNGQEALDWLNKTPNFDGVLMDCQMPVLDGYSATRLLRRQERFKDLPVLAMTANAMVGDREKAIDSGMNDHIAKPINVKDMFKVMAKWIFPSKVIHDSSIPNIPEQGKESISIPSLEGINVDEGLERTQGNKKLYLKLIHKFYQSQVDFIERFKESMDSVDSDDSERIAHTLKGVAGNIGANQVMKDAALLEQACQNHSSKDSLLTLLGKIENSLATVLLPISKLQAPKEINTGAGIKINKSLAKERVLKLSQLLEEDDASAIDIVDELHSMTGIEAYSDVLNKLTKAIEEYDFSLGLEIIKELTFID
jgi:signal transduction histidine kinase/CheY-like chemotaxis protein/HAMP domain-containing protein/CHASE3 domain sensor protein